MVYLVYRKKLIKKGMAIMMVFFKHNELLIPVSKINFFEQKGGYYQGAKRTTGTNNPSFETLSKKKKLAAISLRTDSGEFIDSSEATVKNSLLGLIIEPNSYYDIDGEEFAC